MCFSIAENHRHIIPKKRLYCFNYYSEWINTSKGNIYYLSTQYGSYDMQLH